MRRAAPVPCEPQPKARPVTDTRPVCLLVSGDLMATAWLEPHAQRAGMQLRTALSPQGALKDLAQRPARVVVLDLSRPGLDIAGFVAQCRQVGEPPAAVLAFGPHVDAATLHTAQAAGCAEVFTRGQFHSGAAEILARWLPADESPPKTA